MTNISTSNRPVLHARGISKFFPGTIALDDVELRLMPGEVHALLGENGAGKSTLIKCLTGAYRRDAGVIMLDGTEVEPASTADSQRLGIGTVYQEVNLLPNLTVAENLFLGRQPMRGGFIARKRMNAEARAVLQDYGLEIDPAEPLTAYSVAIQQVIAIARAVEMSGKVLILDEPTASLDGSTALAVMTQLLEVQRQRELACLWITHDQKLADCLAHRVLLMRQGSFE